MGFNRVIHGGNAGGDMGIFIAKYWCKDRDEGRLE